MPIHRHNGLRVWEGGFVPPGMDGITIGTLVMVRRGRVTPYLLRHETVHARQWKRFGPVGFPVRYAAAYAVWRFRRKGHLGAYLRIPMEIEADWVARRSLSTAVTADRVGITSPS